MSKYILIPDSFKGSLSSGEICGILGREIRTLEPEAEICSIPVADGGEGTVDAFLAALSGEKIPVSCRDPYGRAITACYGLLPDGGTAVVEMAAAAALGVKFLDQADRTFVPVGGTLHRIARIRTDGLMPRLREAEVIAMCDIDNPLCGENGAAAVFGPQKGADAQAVRLLDDGLRHLAEVIERDLGGDLLALPGGGAAGGFGAGSAAFLGAKLQMGIETVLELVDFDRLAADADLVITGEGRLDSQSLRGKVVIGVARRAKRLGVPVAALVGSCELPAAAVYEAGVSGIFPIHPQLMPLSEAMAHTREHLAFTAGNMLRFAAAVRKNRQGGCYFH